MNQSNNTSKILSRHKNMDKPNCLSFTTPLYAYKNTALIGSMIPMRKENNSPITVTMLRKNMNRSLLHTYKKRMGLMQLRKQSIDEHNSIIFYIPNSQTQKLAHIKQANLCTQHNTRPNTSIELANSDVVPIKTKYKYADIRNLLKYSNSYFQKKPMAPLRSNYRPLFTNKLLSQVSATANQTPFRRKYSEFYKIIIKCKA